MGVECWFEPVSICIWCVVMVSLRIWRFHWLGIDCGLRLLFYWSCGLPCNDFFQDSWILLIVCGVFTVADWTLWLVLLGFSAFVGFMRVCALEAFRRVTIMPAGVPVLLAVEKLGWWVCLVSFYFDPHVEKRVHPVWCLYVNQKVLNNLRARRK